jgi:hypothetical protein
MRRLALALLSLTLLPALCQAEEPVHQDPGVREVVVKFLERVQ